MNSLGHIDQWWSMHMRCEINPRTLPIPSPLASICNMETDKHNIWYTIYKQQIANYILMIQQKKLWHSHTWSFSYDSMISKMTQSIKAWLGSTAAGTKSSPTQPAVMVGRSCHRWKMVVPRPGNGNFYGHFTGKMEISWDFMGNLWDFIVIQWDINGISWDFMGY